jgi:hypothetical protein
MPTLKFPNGSNVVVTAPAATVAAPSPTVAAAVEPAAPVPIPDVDQRTMRIEAVIPCLNYSDFLAQTLPHNIQHFDWIVVVTSFDDQATVDLCKKLSVECRQTDEWFKHGKCNSGAAVNFGMGFCKQDAWICRMDADIYLPPLARQWIEWSRPDENCIYGVDRVNCPGWHEWSKYISQQQPPDLQHSWHYLVCPPRQESPAWPLLARLAIRAYGGFIPIGFFQMWHTKWQRRYPWNSGTAEHTDVQHAMQWRSKDRRLLPEVIAVHLESEPADFGANWNGRKTKPFGPPSGTPAPPTVPPPQPYVKPN